MPDHLANITTRGNFRAKIESIVASGNAHGYRLVVHNSLRTIEQQKALVAKGHSKTMRSKHLPGPDGLARAADVVDARYLWGAPRHVWVMIGRLALTQGCEWGGLWGLPLPMRRKLAAFLLDRTTPFDPKAWRGKIGWDPAHIEMK
jgi:hypothetical protein